MENRKSVESIKQTGLFTNDDQEVKEFRAGSMSLIVGTSDGFAEPFEEETFEECNYPEIPASVSDEYDTWLG